MSSPLASGNVSSTRRSDVRRHHRWRAVCGLADCDAPGSTGVQGVAGRQSNLPERYHLDAHPLAPRRRDPGAVGSPRHAGGDGRTADLPAHDVRCRPICPSRRHSRRQRWYGRLLSSSYRARQSPGECSGRGRRRGSGRLHRRRLAGERRQRSGRSRPWKRRRASRGARPHCDRRRRRELLRRTSGAGVGVPTFARLRLAATTGTSVVSGKTISSCMCGTTTPSVARRRTMVSTS